MHAPAFPLFNRADFSLPADGKVHVVPLGEYPVEYNGKKLVQVVDDKACRAMLNHLSAEAARPHFGGLCIDFDHFRHDPDKESRAAGWIMDAEQRSDGLFTAPRWTNSGKAAVTGGDYRYISPEFDPGALESLGGSRYRVTRLVGFGLTNSPNMRGMAALTNRLGGVGGTADNTAHADLVSTLARSLRAADKTLSLHLSYSRAAHALDSESNSAGALVISNRARELRAKDKHLSLSESYRLAEEP